MKVESGLLTLSRVQVKSTQALASNWQVRSKKVPGWTADRGTREDGGSIPWPAAQARSSSTARPSSRLKWKLRQEVLGSTAPPCRPSKVTTEEAGVLTSMMESLKDRHYEEKQQAVTTLLSL